MQDATWLGPLCAFMSSVTWAWGSTRYTILAAEHSPFAINFSRALVSLPLCLLAALWVAGGPTALAQELAGIPAQDVMWLAISIFACYGLGDVFFMWSARSIGVPAAAAIASTYPVGTALYQAVFMGDLPTRGQVGGVLLAVAGVVAVILSRKQGHSQSKSTRGVLLAFATLVAWVFNGLGVARGAAHVNPFAANVLRMTMALGMAAAMGRVFARGRSTQVVLPPQLLIRSIPLFAVEAFGGSVLFLYGMSHSPLAIGATLTSLAPVISVPISLALRLERFSLVRTLGVCAVALGCWLLVANG